MNVPGTDEGFEVVYIPGTGGNIDVVGESNYQRNLDQVLKLGQTACAVLRPEPHNKFDPNAIAVAINGLLVGHISAELAAQMQPMLLEYQNKKNVRLACQADVYEPQQEDPYREFIEVELRFSLNAAINAKRPKAAKEKKQKPQKNSFQSCLSFVCNVVAVIGFIILGAIWYSASKTAGNKAPQPMEVAAATPEIPVPSPVMDSNFRAAMEIHANTLIQKGISAKDAGTLQDGVKAAMEAGMTTTVQELNRLGWIAWLKTNGHGV